MGLLTDVVIADESEAQSIAASGAESRPKIQCKDLDNAKLGSLLELLSKSRSQSLETFPLVAERSNQGPWVFRIPDEMIDYLAAISDEERLEDIADQWAETEEFQLDRWSVADAEDILKELTALARAARSAGKGLLLWMCL